MLLSDSWLEHRNWRALLNLMGDKRCQTVKIQLCLYGHIWITVQSYWKWTAQKCKPSQNSLRQKSKAQFRIYWTNANKMHSISKWSKAETYTLQTKPPNFPKHLVFQVAWWEANNTARITCSKNTSLKSLSDFPLIYIMYQTMKNTVHATFWQDWPSTLR